MLTYLQLFYFMTALNSRVPFHSITEVIVLFQ